MYVVLFIALIAALMSLYEDIQYNLNGTKPVAVKISDIEDKGLPGGYFSVIDGSSPGIFVASKLGNDGEVNSIVFSIPPYEKSIALKNGDKSIPMKIFVRRTIDQETCHLENNYCLSINPEKITGMHETDSLDNHTGYLSGGAYRVLKNAGYQVSENAIVIEEDRKPMGLWGNVALFVLVVLGIIYIVFALFTSHSEKASAINQRR